MKKIRYVKPAKLFLPQFRCPVCRQETGFYRRIYIKNDMFLDCEKCGTKINITGEDEK